MRARTGRDFSRYKSSTMARRVARRMQLNRLEELGDYLELLRSRPEEVRALADDLLITVTNFFRDVEVFEALGRDVVPRLFEGKNSEDRLRVWSVGCATGEEAYSLAILLLEEAARRESPPQLQVFASDLHEGSLEKARDGFYPGDIETDVSPERLRHFFVEEEGGFRIRGGVRQIVVFAPHDLLADPPFAHLDLVVCRNVLIYLQREAQRDVVELFHYALRPGGHLVLGTSESIDGSELFRVENEKACIHRKREVPAPEPRLPVFPLARPDRGGSPGAHPHDDALVAYGDLHQRMLEQYAPPSVLVSPEDDIVHVSEHAGRYLVHPGGEMTANLFELVRQELRIELRSALQAARRRQETTRSEPVLVQFDDALRPVVVDVQPARALSDEGFVLVVFDERASDDHVAATMAPEQAIDTRREALQAELDLAGRRLQAIIEEYETGQEEMNASNEELQSTTRSSRRARRSSSR